VVALFMTGGEKLKCGWLATTPGTRLDGGEGASTLPLRPLAAAPMVRNSGAATR
jgi:hypothetical protein